MVIFQCQFSAERKVVGIQTILKQKAERFSIVDVIQVRDRGIDDFQQTI
jgi:hypothetical protein